MHSGNSLNMDNPPALSIALGIASLVIEGRPLFDDEYVLDSNQELRNDSLGRNCVTNFFPALSQFPSLLSPIDAKMFHLAARKSNIDITSTPTSTSFASKSDSVKHLERLRQKLHQLRSLPSTSRDIAEHIINVSSTEATTSNETELDGELEVIFKRRSLPITSTIEKSPKSIDTLQLFVPTGISLQRTPRSLIEHNGLLQTVTSWTDSKFSPGQFSTPTTTSTASNLTSPSSASSSASFISPSTSSFSLKQEKRKGKVLGPHCEQFLAKIGLMKSTSISGHSIEIESHECLPNNETCFRWQQCYKQLIPILAQGEPICIEVYLGPENHVILLEQWIIEQNSDAGRFSMTIQSLCTAIRSQLHFSQITAWSDLLKVTSSFDNDFKSNPRIKSTPFQSKLDILYRIRPYTEASTSCFSAIPLVHNFPEIFINDQLSLKVSLKSLPRKKSIPSLYDPNVISGDLMNVTTTLQSCIVDDRQEFGCNEKGKHRCPYDEESPTDDATSHRDKQLLKYKKRMLRRDKKKRHDETTTPLNAYGISIKNGSTTQYDQTINPNKPPLYSSMSVDDSEPCKPTINPNPIVAMSFVNDDHKTINSIDLSNNNDNRNNNNVVNNTISSMLTKSTQTTAIEMTSIGTQTDDGQIVFHKCDFCGIEMQYFCWNCDKRMFINGSADSQLNLEKADLLLKAIQRTPLAVQQTINIKKNRARCSADNANDTYSAEPQLELNNNSNSNNINNVICRVPAMNIDNYNININNNNNDNNNYNKTMTPNDVCDVSSDKYNCDNYSNISKDELDLGDTCCKRKKTMHNYYRDPSTNTIIGSHSNNNSPSRNLSRDDLFVTQHGHAECSGSYRRTMSESVVGTCHTDTENYTQPGIALTTCDTMNILSENELKLYRRAYSEDELICNCDDNRPKQLDLNKMNSPPIQHQQDQHEHDFPLTAHLCLAADEQTESQFKTPINKQLSSCTTAYDQQTKPIYIDCHNNRNDDDDDDDDDDDVSQDSAPSNVAKLLPKINLTKLFADSMDTSPADMLAENEFDVEKELRKLSQATLPKFSLKFDFEHLSPPLTSPVVTQSWRSQMHKSNSAPSYSPPTLSPRFLKSVRVAAATKRRSRHLSDRSSERLSFGSDDHFSDEDFCTEYRPGISPNKASLRFFPKNYAFRKRALLGSFEESLLQRRFEPKFLVPGYKVLLGASGCYCTNQITIPAYTFFYEMNAETLSTPYVCEVSMPPRKGYVIPRTGHVQATLLNPNGMVVRMFVVQYDFRDMPAMCQTFVRQRILSFDENANPGQSVDDLSPSEQMKLLRYAIHLRFQTTRSGRLSLHGDIRMLISRRTDCDTAAAHAKGTLESPSELKTVTIVPENPKFSSR